MINGEFCTSVCLLLYEVGFPPITVVELLIEAIPFIPSGTCCCSDKLIPLLSLGSWFVTCREFEPLELILLLGGMFIVIRDFAVAAVVLLATYSPNVCDGCKR